jgi:hypothetical protein
LLRLDHLITQTGKVGAQNRGSQLHRSPVHVRCPRRRVQAFLSFL